MGVVGDRPKTGCWGAGSFGARSTAGMRTRPGRASSVRGALIVSTTPADTVTARPAAATSSA
jgi:hypothetical protein